MTFRQMDSRVFCAELIVICRRQAPLINQSDESAAHCGIFLKDGWAVRYSGNVLANWQADKDNRWTVPLGLGVSKIVKFGKLPAMPSCRTLHHAHTAGRLRPDVEHSAPNSAGASEAR